MRKLVVAIGVAAFAVGGLAACGDDGDSAEDLQDQVAENRLGGCLQDAGIDFDVFEQIDSEELNDIIDNLLDEFADVESIEDVDEFFSEFDEQFSDFSENLTDEDLSEDFGTASGEFSEQQDEAFSDEDDLLSFLDCLGISEEEYSDFIEDLEQEFSDGASDFTEEDFSEDFSEDFTEGTDFTAGGEDEL